MEKPSISLNMDPIVKEVTDLADKIANPAAEEIGLLIGNLVHLARAKTEIWRIKADDKVTRLQNQLQSRIDEIPEEKRILASLQVTVQALENAIFCIDSEDLSDMFAKLIASSVNIDMVDYSHPGFIEILKQMSPLDAKLYKDLFRNETRYGVGSIVYQFENGTYQPYLEHLFPFPDDLVLGIAPQVVSASITNLVRLGLITIDKDRFFTEASRYDPLLNHPLLTENRVRVKSGDTFGSPELKKMSWAITTFGKHFAYNTFVNHIVIKAAMPVPNA